MLVRPITKEERLQSAQLFAIAFESPFDPNDLTPFGKIPASGPRLTRKAER